MTNYKALGLRTDYENISMKDTEEDFTISFICKDFVLNTREQKREFFFEFNKYITKLRSEIKEQHEKLCNICHAGGWDEY